MWLLPVQRHLRDVDLIEWTQVVTVTLKVLLSLVTDDLLCLQNRKRGYDFLNSCPRWQAELGKTFSDNFFFPFLKMEA